MFVSFELLYFSYSLYRFRYLSNAWSCSVFQSHFVSLLSSGLNGARSFAKFGINRFIWFIASINDRKSFKFRGFSLSDMAWILLSIEFTPVAVSLYPSHSVSDCAIWHFFSFSRMLASSRIFITFSTCFMFSSLLPFVTIRISSMKVNVFCMLCRICT